MRRRCWTLSAFVLVLIVGVAGTVVAGPQYLDRHRWADGQVRLSTLRYTYRSRRIPICTFGPIYCRLSLVDQAKSRLSDHSESRRPYDDLETSLNINGPFGAMVVALVAAVTVDAWSPGRNGGYRSSPSNTTIFASTGGDGVHFSVLHSGDLGAVVMNAPMAFDRPNSNWPVDGAPASGQRSTPFGHRGLGH